MATAEPHAGTPRTATCPMCGQQFTCGLSATCWCSTRRVPEEVRSWLADHYETCVCSACLDRVVEQGIPEA
ncbi:MAG: cysteine-rich CWC family protein [Chlorobiaceae bacterium]|nr:cysteine-rich CWC family protein [Chlorobiaceae bacterium]